MRNPSIELYRVLLIFGISLLHAAITPKCASSWLANCFSFCVDGFAFITGYYGCQFKIVKVVRLLALGLFCAAIGCITADDGRSLMDQFSKFWFLHAYLVMLSLSPFANALVDKDGCVLPFLFFVFGYGFLKTLPFPWVNCLPVMPGITAYSGLTLFGVYVCARYFAKKHVEDRLSTGVALLMFCVGLILSSVGLNDYNSPVALLLAGTSFVLLKRVRLPKFVATAACVVAPSVFSIYLLQATQINRMYACVRWLAGEGESKYVCYVVVACGTFIICLGVDLLRRGVVCVFRRPIRWTEETTVKFAQYVRRLSLARKTGGAF